MKTGIFLLLLLLCCDLSWAEVHRVKSPDRKLEFVISNDGGNLVYKIAYDGRDVITSSDLAWSVGGETLGRRTETLSLVKKYKGNDRYPTRGTHSLAIDKHNGFLFEIDDAGGRTWKLDVRLFNEGVGFRYMMEGAGKVPVDEHTTFNLPAGERPLWSQKDTKGYEGVYFR